jgi:hypothetical protein
VQHAFRALSYFDVLGRSRLTIRLTRITLSLPIALERALAAEASFGSNLNVGQGEERREGKASGTGEALLFPRHVTLLIRGVDGALERMERILK